MVFSALGGDEPLECYVLDGYPRTIVQALGTFAPPDMVVCIGMSDDTARR
jgi:hypothetical protein